MSEGVWFAKVVNRLRELRAAGYGFDTAWTVALHEFPPRARDDGGHGQMSLAVNGDETVVGFFRRVCENAWYDERTGPGNGPALRYFNVEMLRDEPREQMSGVVPQAA